MHSRAVLFTWELKERSKFRRWFYVNLRRLLDELPEGCWCKLGGSVYLVDERYSARFVMLLKKFEGPELTWHSFEIVRRV